MAVRFEADLETYEGSGKENRHHWLRNWRDYSQFYMQQMLPESHSTKHIEDCVVWALETTPETILLREDSGALYPATLEEAEATCGSIHCPVLIVQGDQDNIVPPARSRRMAELTGGRLVWLEGSGHLPPARHPVTANRLIGEFVDSISPPQPKPQRWTFALNRPKRSLYLSSPIGLGHALRDVAIADELRKLHPELQIEWLTQHPVTEVLRARGEHVHPASEFLANESAHFESEAGEHDLHAFQAIRRMDEILVANFMVFQDLMEDEHFDLVIGDEAWDVDHFLHENPELKRTQFAWMTDFVGWLPMPDGGEREAFLAADYNAEMVEHIARYPRLRDRSIFVGDPDDIVPDRLGPDLPPIREWTEAHYAFSGYVTGFDPAAMDRERIRADLGYQREEKVCLVSVGGSGVGEHLLRKVIAAYPEAKRAVPELRMVVVAGPRIDPGSLPAQDGLEVRGYVDGLYRHFAACDLAVVQGGLSTCMELAALKRPFLYFPLRHHFEQNFHVRHRLERHRAGRCMDYEGATPEALAAAIAAEIDRPVDYREVGTDGASRAAALIAELL